jgi:XTP/dITP diphosphohydrolase
MSIKEIVIATSNKNKILEISNSLQKSSIKLYSQDQFSIASVEETGLTYVENAIIKAREASRISKLPSLADDSGIEVEVLNGRPGIFSARYSDTGECIDNNYKLLSELESVPYEERNACFKCVLVLLKHYHDPSPLIFSGEWEGKIIIPKDNIVRHGFGYDPIFFDHKVGKLALDMTITEKHLHSHRGKALMKLIDYLQNISEYQ